MLKKILEILNLEVHQNCITGSRVTVLLLNGRILPIGGASVVEGRMSPKATLVMKLDPGDLGLKAIRLSS